MQIQCAAILYPYAIIQLLWTARQVSSLADLLHWIIRHGLTHLENGPYLAKVHLILMHAVVGG